MDCCCLCSDRVKRRHRRRFRIRFFTDEEEAELLAAADTYNRDTGRTCGDFFKTMRLPGNPGRLLADRPTLLTKVTNLNQANALFAATTICASLKPEPGVWRVINFHNTWLDPGPDLGTFRTEAAADRVIEEYLTKFPFRRIYGPRKEKLQL